MIHLRVETLIAAPVARCFDLSRSVDAHVLSAAETDERVVEGRTSGLLELGEEVTWEARHFGIRQRLSSRIVVMQRPQFFQDRMTRGAFKSFEHDHLFSETPNGETLMVDLLRIEAPWGLLGRVAERCLLASHLRRFLEQRAHALKQLAESDQWRRFLPEE